MIDTNIAYTQLPYIGLLSVQGADAESFLQGQLSCDVTKLTQDRFTLAAYCNLQGKVVANAYLCRWQNGFLLRLMRDNVSNLINTLKKYAVFSKVSLEDVSNEYSVYGQFLPQATLQAWHCKASQQGLMLGLPGTEARVEYISKTQLADSQQTTISEQDWQLAELRSGVAQIYADCSEAFLPHRLNYQQLGAISFNKGCYLGQEIIARLHYRGQIKHQLYHYRLSDLPSELVRNTGVNDLNGRNIGQIVNIASDEALIIMLKQHADDEQVEILGQSVNLTHLALPTIID